MRMPLYILVAAAAIAAPARAGMTSSFLYTLDDPASKRAYGWASLSFDAQAREIFLVSGGVIDVFNENGLATYAFGDDTDLGQPVAAVSIDDGTIFVLASKDQAMQIVRCNYRGEPQAKLQITGLPPEFATDFRPGRIATAQGRLYLADTESMKVASISTAGAAIAFWSLPELIGLGPRNPAEAMMRGFDVDRDGNVLFTVASVFSAYVLSPDGKLKAFGVRGSTPGKFNIVSGITADDEGHLYLTDTLRAVVMVFDRDFKFLGEFGYRGSDPENLASPFSIAVGNRRVYVSQSRGAVKAFAVRFE